MNNKKNIDRLFQEKFKDFEVNPDPKVWQNIESKLNKEEKKDRLVIIPFWLKLSGIAASLLLMLFLGKSLLNSPETSTVPNVVDTKKTESKAPENTSNNSDANVNTNNKEDFDTSEIALEDKSSNDIKNNTVTSTNNSEKENKISTKNEAKNNLYLPRNNSNSSNNTVVSGNPSSLNDSQNKQDNFNSNSDNLNNSVFTSDTNSSNYKTNNTDVASTNNQDKNKSVSPINDLNKAIDNSTKNDAIANVKSEEKTDNKKQDLQKQSIEEAIAENKNTEEDLIEKEEVANRWSVNTNISPVYYDIIGEGSHIHDQFKENTKSGAINTSYGVKVGYAINDNFTVRSGINRLDLSYDTNDVVVFEKFDANSSLRNINFARSVSGQPLNLINAKSINVIEATKESNSSISQQMRYYEVPLELEYKLLKSRIGINLIGGFSTFLLGNNQLVSQFQGTEIKVGEANNINNVSFSTNFGIGIDYKASKSVIFNVEPTFKYHLNAFNQTSGNFNPYILGLYTGVSYRF